MGLADPAVPLSALLARSDIRRGDALAQVASPSVPTGFAALDAQAQAGAVEEATRAVQKGRAHGGVERVHQVAHGQRRAPSAVRLPGGLVDEPVQSRRSPELG